VKYIKVRWLHASPDIPTLLYSELNPQLWEVRKVEAYADGRMDFADREGRSGSTKLSVEPLPPLEQILADPEFEPIAISAAEFESVWEQAQASNDRT
jgi:hypothetical protein